jgi:hypothetical protein
MKVSELRSIIRVLPPDAEIGVRVVGHNEILEITGCEAHWQRCAIVARLGEDDIEGT